METQNTVTVQEVAELIDARRFDLAEAHCRILLETHQNHPGAFFLSGIVADWKNDHHTAISHFHKAIELNSQIPEYYNELGKVLRKLNQFEQAKLQYQRAIGLAPDYAEPHNNLGNVYILQGKSDMAIEHYRKAISLVPNYAKAHNNLGCVLGDIGESEEAKRHLEKAIDLEPNYLDAHYNLGRVWHNENLLDQAEAKYRWILEKNSSYGAVWNNLGLVLQEKLQMAEAIRCFREAIFLNTQDADAHKNLGLALLLSGNYVQGFAEYEWREALPKKSGTLWQGASIKGRSILICDEQGFGDSFQFVRYLPLLKTYGCRIIVECKPKLFKILQRMEAIDELVMVDNVLPDYDVYVPLLSLPHLLKTTLASIPKKIPYLSVAPQNLPQLPKGAETHRKVGVVWASKTAIGQKKSCDLETFQTIFSTPQVTFFSFQTDISIEEKALVDAQENLIDLATDFYETACFLTQMDLLISVDTGVAHLAGALGKSVWLLLPYSPDWRWLLNRNDSPWYPTIQLFRQEIRGDWKGVIEKVSQALNNQEWSVNY